MNPMSAEGEHMRSHGFVMPAGDVRIGGETADAEFEDFADAPRNAYPWASRAGIRLQPALWAEACYLVAQTPEGIL